MLYENKVTWLHFCGGTNYMPYVSVKEIHLPYVLWRKSTYLTFLWRKIPHTLRFCKV